MISFWFLPLARIFEVSPCSSLSAGVGVNGVSVSAAAVANAAVSSEPPIILNPILMLAAHIAGFYLRNPGSLDGWGYDEWDRALGGRLDAVARTVSRTPAFTVSVEPAMQFIARAGGGLRRTFPFDFRQTVWNTLPTELRALCA